MGMCLPCLSGAGDDVVVTPDPVSTFNTFINAFISITSFTVFIFQVLTFPKQNANLTS